MLAPSGSRRKPRLSSGACPAGVDSKSRLRPPTKSDVPIAPGDMSSRPTAGGGGCGDPLERDPEAVREDVADDYVSLERARKDYGVVLRVVDRDLADYEIDYEATRRERDHICRHRRAWLEENPETVTACYRSGEIDMLDSIRQYGVILDWGSGRLLPKTTEQFRDMFRKRTAAHWTDAADVKGLAAE